MCVPSHPYLCVMREDRPASTMVSALRQQETKMLCISLMHMEEMHSVKLLSTYLTFFCKRKEAICFLCQKCHDCVYDSELRIF